MGPSCGPFWCFLYDENSWTILYNIGYLTTIRVLQFLAKMIMVNEGALAVYWIENLKMKANWGKEY